MAGTSILVQFFSQTIIGYSIKFQGAKMKKFIVSLIACITMVQSTYAATSALTESLLEYEAITSAIGTDPTFQNIIPVTEFIIDIKRITKKINVLGKVKYEIVTRASSDGSSKHDKHLRSIKYIATLNVAQNPGIGPNIVTVVSVEQVHGHHHHHHHHS